MSGNDYDDTQLLPAEVVALRMGLHVRTLYSLCKNRKIRHMRVGPRGGRYVFRESWIGEYLNSCEVAPEDRARTRESTKRRMSRATNKQVSQSPVPDPLTVKMSQWVSQSK